MDNIIELVELTKQYDGHTAVDHLNLSIQRSEIFGLLGPNGAGKSTTILMMLGLTEPTSGSVRVCGKDSTKEPIEVKRRVGYLPEDVGFYEDYTGLENLMFTALLNGLGKNLARKKAEELLERVDLTAQANKKAGKYSRGMRQRLGLADVLIKDPEVIILDELTLGIDPKGVQELLALIHQLSKQDGLTVLLSSHHLQQVQEICDRVGLFVDGKLLAEGAVQNLAQKLFENHAYTIEAEVVFAGNGAGPEILKRNLTAIIGVQSVHLNGNIFEVGSSHNVAPEIAREVLASGASLHGLTKRAYGLEEIYNHYFRVKENGQSH